MTSASAQSAVGSALSTWASTETKASMSQFAHGASSLNSTVLAHGEASAANWLFCFRRQSATDIANGQSRAALRKRHR